MFPSGFGNMRYMKLMCGYDYESKCWNYQVHTIDNEILYTRLPFLAELLDQQEKSLDQWFDLPDFLGVTPDVMRLLISWANNFSIYYTDDGFTFKIPESDTIIHLYVLAHKIRSHTLQNHIIDFLIHRFHEHGIIITSVVPRLWEITAEMSSVQHCALRNLIVNQCVLLNTPVQFYQQAGYPIEFLEVLSGRMFSYSSGQYDFMNDMYFGSPKYYVAPYPHYFGTAPMATDSDQFPSQFETLPLQEPQVITRDDILDIHLLQSITKHADATEPKYARAEAVEVTPDLDVSEALKKQNHNVPAEAEKTRKGTQLYSPSHKRAFNPTEAKESESYALVASKSLSLAEPKNESEEKVFAAKDHWPELKPLTTPQTPTNPSIAEAQVLNTPAAKKTIDERDLSVRSWADEVEGPESGVLVKKVPLAITKTPALATQESSLDCSTLGPSPVGNNGPVSKTKKNRKKQSKNIGIMTTAGLLAKLKPIHSDTCPYKLLQLDCPHRKTCKLRGVCIEFSQEKGCQSEDCKLAHVPLGCKAVMESKKGSISAKCQKKGSKHLENVAHKGQGTSQFEQEQDWKSRYASFQLLKAHSESASGEWE